jgi:hypothetical protein
MMLPLPSPPWRLVHRRTDFERGGDLSYPRTTVGGLTLRPPRPRGGFRVW